MIIIDPFNCFDHNVVIFNIFTYHFQLNESTFRTKSTSHCVTRHLTPLEPLKFLIQFPHDDRDTLQ